VAEGTSPAVIVGKISAVYGIKGWLKIHSYTDPITNLMDFEELQLKQSGQRLPIRFDHWRKHGKGLVAHIKGCDDRDEARRYVGQSLEVLQDAMPALEEGEYYWSQLLGLQVFSNYETGPGVLLGRVHHLLETGANDVLVVRACEGSLDKRERLIPYLPDDVIQNINIVDGMIIVNWDPAF
jgi:16S rRNA processing protein RimM